MYADILNELWHLIKQCEQVVYRFFLHGTVDHLLAQTDTVVIPVVQNAALPLSFFQRFPYINPFSMPFQ